MSIHSQHVAAIVTGSYRDRERPYGNNTHWPRRMTEQLKAHHTMGYVYGCSAIRWQPGGNLRHPCPGFVYNLLPTRRTKERVHQIGRAVAWTCGMSGGTESHRYADVKTAKAVAHKIRLHVHTGGWTGRNTMRAIAEDAQKRVHWIWQRIYATRQL